LNAIYKMRRVLEALEGYCEGLDAIRHPLIGSPSGAVTLIQGGHKESAVPDRCELVLDRRMVPGESQDAVVGDLERLLRALQAADPELGVAIEGYLPTSGPPSETPRDARLVGLATEAVREVTGAPGEVYGAGFGCDMTHFARSARRRSSSGRETSSAPTRRTSGSASTSWSRALASTRPSSAGWSAEPAGAVRHPTEAEPPAGQMAALHL